MKLIDKLNILVKLSIALVIVGAILKILHLPYATITILCGFGGVIIFYPIKFWSKDKKVFLDYVKLIFVISAIIKGVLSLWHYPYKEIFHFIALISGGIWFLMEGYSYIVLTEDNNNINDNPSEISNSKINIPNLLYGISVVCVIVLPIFIVFHWSYWQIFAIVGVVSFILSLFYDSIFPKQ